MENKLTDEELEKIAGGQEPEEFDWKSKGYQTPIKEEDDSGWHFEAIGDIDGTYRKIIGGSNEETINQDKIDEMVYKLSRVDILDKAILESLINLLKDYGPAAAIEGTRRVIINDEDKKNEIIKILRG